MTIDQPAAGAYPIATREQVLDSMAGYPGYGEQRWYTAALRAEHVSFSWRRMPAGTGGRGSYGHRHPGQEEVYFVISGTHVQDRRRRLRSWPQTAIWIAGEAYRFVHNDDDTEAELLIFSPRLAEPPLEKRDRF